MLRVKGLNLGFRVYRGLSTLSSGFKSYKV